MPIYKMNGKKDGRQQYRVRINYTDQYGKAKQIDRSVYGLAEAKDLERQLGAEMKGGQLPSSRLTVHQLYQQFVDSKRHDLRASSFEKSCGILERHVLPTLGSVQITKLTVPVLQNWKNNISDQGFAIRTKKNIYAEFRSLLNFAVKSDLLAKNPLLNVGNFKDVYLTEETTPLSYYTAEQFLLFIQAAIPTTDTLTDWGYYVFFNIAFYTGMRKGEINALKWSDLEGNVIHVRRSVAQKNKGGDFEGPPKNKTSFRSLQIPAPLIKVLAEHQAKQKLLPEYTDDWRICGCTRFLRDTSISNRNIKFANAADLPIIRIHDFRHSHASLLANEGINIQEIARRLGHSNIEVTWNTYSHLYPREEDRAVQILNTIMIHS